MNIHVLSQLYLPEPAGVFTADLVERWVGAGHDLTVWTAVPDSDAHLGGARFHLGPPYDRSSLLARTTSQLRFLMHAGWGVAFSAGAGGRPDAIVVVGSPLVGLLLPILRRLYPAARIVHWVHDLYPEALSALRPRGAVDRWFSRPLRRATDLAFAAASVVVAISPAMAKCIEQRVPGVDVRTIPLWAPAAVVPQMDRATALRGARGISEHAFVVMYHGNLGLAYDFAPLLRVARLLAKMPAFAIVIVGEGAQLESLKAEVEAQQMTNVRFFPPVAPAALSDSLAMGDCHVVSMRRGWSGVAFPAKFITAIAAARPVLLLGPADTELAELVCSCECGSVVSDGDALAGAVLALEQSVTLARRQSEAGRRLYEEQFERAAALARWDALLTG